MSDLTTLNSNFPGCGLAITPSDTVPLTKIVRQLRANTAGTIKITNVDDTTVTLSFAAGESRPVGAKLVWSTGTTCTGIEGIY